MMPAHARRLLAVLPPARGIGLARADIGAAAALAVKRRLLGVIGAAAAPPDDLVLGTMLLRRRLRLEAMDTRRGGRRGGERENSSEKDQTQAHWMAPDLSMTRKE